MKTDRFSKAKEINARVSEEKNSDIDISKIKPNPFQPRKIFDEVALQELATTIKKDGLLQPIVITKRESGYIIVAGERRYRATLLNKSKTIKASVINISDEKMQELALLENIQRENLTDFELSEAVNTLWDSGNYATKGELAQALGKTQSYISKCFAVIKMSDGVKDIIKENNDNISTSVMIELSKVPQEKQTAVLQDYKDGKVKRDEITKMIKNKEHIKVKFKKVISSDDLEKWEDVMTHLKSLNILNKKYTITIKEV